MQTDQYIKLAKKTEDETYNAATKRLERSQTVRLLHAAMGLSTEANEVLDQLKRHIFYGKDIDNINLKEELGDIFWYAAIMADALSINFENIMATNISKLKKRYGEKFTENKALLRDLQHERQILEKT